MSTRESLRQRLQVQPGIDTDVCVHAYPCTQTLGRGAQEQGSAARANGELQEAFRQDVLAGLAAPPRVIPARWLYDRAGSELFEAITALPDYYPTRTERAILKAHASEIARLTGPGRTVVEFGSGSSLKTPLLLAAVAPAAYIPIDISGDYLAESAKRLAEVFPALPVLPVVADFTKPVVIPQVKNSSYLGFFPGSTIGNLVAPVAVALLHQMGVSLGAGAQLLVGIDRIKDSAVLLPAYDDEQGITAKFNLNLLHRINRELHGDIPVGSFRHLAVWNEAEARIEMHLQALRDVKFAVAGVSFQLRAGETIHTENSIKYGPRDARLLLRAGGWTPIGEWVDDQQSFAVILAEVTPPGLTP